MVNIYVCYYGGWVYYESHYYYECSMKTAVATKNYDLQQRCFYVGFTLVLHFPHGTTTLLRLRNVNFFCSLPYLGLLLCWWTSFLSITVALMGLYLNGRLIIPDDVIETIFCFVYISIALARPSASPYYVA